MIPRKKKLCKCGCGKEGYVWARGYLKGHEPIKEKPFRVMEQMKRKPTGELVLFEAIWKSRPHVCQVTDQPIKHFSVSCFMHVLSKGAYPKFRLFDRNILLVMPDVHDKYDCGDRSDPMFEKVRKLHDELVQLYYKKSG